MSKHKYKVGDIVLWENPKLHDMHPLQGKHKVRIIYKREQSGSYDIVLVDSGVRKNFFTEKCMTEIPRVVLSEIYNKD